MFDANTFNRNLSGADRAPDRLWQWGGTVGGPVFRNLPRNAVKGPLNWGSNLALLKKVHFTGRVFLQLRGEAYNFLNYNNLSNPVVAINSSDFGRIMGRSGTA